MHCDDTPPHGIDIDAEWERIIAAEAARDASRMAHPSQGKRTPPRKQVAPGVVIAAALALLLLAIGLGN
jgi:hypothetical protein